ncbi:MAG: hypothetical protein HY698_03600 [Deltaproteobacteria bacterium]|nr:hypothetical protein [Deltaproteobacteria bacterium]
MSEKDIKKPGARDISDLKARLGLKKGPDSGTAARPSPFNGAAANVTNGQGEPPAVPAPTAAKLGTGHVPPPPGIARPPGTDTTASAQAIQQPIVPDARLDPFGAMNAMAAQTAAHAAPTYVIVDDGKPVESVQKKSLAARMKWIGVALGLLIVGSVMGGISARSKIYNATIDDAANILEHIRESSAGLQALNEALLVAKDRGDDKQSFLPGDAELTKALDELLKTGKLKDPDSKLFFRANLFNMEPQLVEDTLRFYGDLSDLLKLVKDHVKYSQADEKQIAETSEIVRKLGPQARLGAIFRMPRDTNSGLPLVEIVQVGSPMCADNQPHPDGCPSGATPIGYQYRPDINSPNWGSKAWSKDTIAAENIVFLGQSSVLDSLLRGTKPSVAEASYMRRIQKLNAETERVIDARKSLENRMNAKAQESKHFSLF